MEANTEEEVTKVLNEINPANMELLQCVTPPPKPVDPAIPVTSPPSPTSPDDPKVSE